MSLSILGGKLALNVLDQKNTQVFCARNFTNNDALMADLELWKK